MNKDKFRAQSRKKLIKISSSVNSYKKHKSIHAQVMQIIKYHNPKNILLYIPLGLEFDTKNLISTLRRKSKANILVPFMQNISFKVVKYRLPLYRKKFELLEPNDSFTRIRNIDLVIVPVIGVDGAIKRVGFGKGMYDRFFETLPRRPITVFVQLHTCFCKQIITNKYDIQADYYITP